MIDDLNYIKEFVEKAKTDEKEPVVVKKYDKLAKKLDKLEQQQVVVEECDECKKVIIKNVDDILNYDRKKYPEKYGLKEGNGGDKKQGCTTCGATEYLLSDLLERFDIRESDIKPFQKRSLNPFKRNRNKNIASRSNDILK